jgi:branched-chain amino acid transport system permease protein
MLTSSGRAPVVTQPMLVFFAIMFSFPFWADAAGLYHYLGVEIAVFIIYALGYNLLLGYTGLPSFGHGAFLGIGAYSYGLWQFSGYPGVFTGLAVAIVCAAAAAGAAALFLSHRRGIYFALMTIAFGQIFWFLAIKLRWITGGEDGLLNVLRPTLDFGALDISLRSNLTLFYLVAVLLTVLILVLWRLVHSPFGTALQAIRMNEMRARFAGYRVWLIKWTVFTLSGAIAGLAGALLCITQESAYPDVMSLHASGFVVMMTLIGGGFVSFWGPVVGAIVFILARDVLGAATETWLLWYGLLFMAVMLVEPEGVVGAWRKLIAKLRRSSVQPGPAQEPKPAAEGGAA